MLRSASHKAASEEPVLLGSHLQLGVLCQLIQVVGRIQFLVVMGDGARFLAGCQLEVHLHSPWTVAVYRASYSMTVDFFQASRILSFSPCEFQEGPPPY